jgi:hypothetical protein
MFIHHRHLRNPLNIVNRTCAAVPGKILYCNVSVVNKSGILVYSYLIRHSKYLGPPNLLNLRITTCSTGRIEPECNVCTNSNIAGAV